MGKARSAVAALEAERDRLLKEAGRAKEDIGKIDEQLAALHARRTTLVERSAEVDEQLRAHGYALELLSGSVAAPKVAAGKSKAGLPVAEDDDFDPVSDLDEETDPRGEPVSGVRTLKPGEDPVKALEKARAADEGLTPAKA